jgi:hypothetical protein
MSNSSYIGRYLLTLGKIYLLVCPFFEPFFSVSIVKKRNFLNRMLLLTRAVFYVNFCVLCVQYSIYSPLLYLSAEIANFVTFFNESESHLQRNNAMVSVSP